MRKLSPFLFLLVVVAASQAIGPKAHAHGVTGYDTAGMNSADMNTVGIRTAAIGLAAIDPVYALETAMIERNLYLRVDYPAQMRAMRNEQLLTQSRVASLKKRLRAYGPMNRFDTGKALLVTIDRTKFNLLQEELHLRELRAQMNDAARYHRHQVRLLSLKVEQAQRTVAAYRKAKAQKPQNHQPQNRQETASSAAATSGLLTSN